MTGIMESNGVIQVYHISPIHYLPFILRSGCLFTKKTLDQQFSMSHFRSMSDRHDRSRGFNDCAFLTTTAFPPILNAKLSKGFPHIRYEIPSSYIEEIEYSLCRFNIAMTRYLRRNSKPGFSESETNGRYYGQQQIPVARSDQDKSSMLSHHMPKKTMIEVIIHEDLILPSETVITCFSIDDYRRVSTMVRMFDAKWEVVSENYSGYVSNEQYEIAIDEYLAIAIGDPNWKGNGLEFDRV